MLRWFSIFVCVYLQATFHCKIQHWFQRNKLYVVIQLKYIHAFVGVQLNYIQTISRSYTTETWLKEQIFLGALFLYNNCSIEVILYYMSPSSS
jgi:hypothetical protein